MDMMIAVIASILLFLCVLCVLAVQISNSVHELGGVAAQTTNNWMEMQAAITDGETLSISIIQVEPP